GRHRRNRLANHRIGGSVFRVEIYQLDLARADLDAAHLGTKLPGHGRVSVGDELHFHRAAFIHLVNRLGGDVVGLAVQAGNITDHVVERHHGKTETEHQHHGDHQ